MHGRSNRNGILTYSKGSCSLNKNINFLAKRFMSKRKAIFLKFIHFVSNKTYYGLIKYSNGAYSNIALANGMIPGHFVKCTSFKNSIFNRFGLGDTVLLLWLTRRHVFYNIYLPFLDKIVFAKAPGTYCNIVSNNLDKNYFKVKLPSGENKIIFNKIFVSLGRNSNVLQKSVVYGKAGIVVKNGYKPTVRGVAMNPVDHPHGGRTKTNSPEKTPWGKVAKLKK